MKTFALFAATLGMALAGAASAQTTTQQQVMPNGNVRTTTTHEGQMGGMHETTRVDRPDGTTREVRRDTGPMGNTRMMSRDDRNGSPDWHGGQDHMRGNRQGGGWNQGHGEHGGWNRERRVCKTRWHHGHRERHCWMRR